MPTDRDDQLLTFWKRSLFLNGRISFRGEHCAKKLGRVRSVYELGEDSTVLVLYDDTVLNGAEDGCVVTTTGIGLNSALEEPHWFDFTQLEPKDIAPSADKTPCIKGHAASMSLISQALRNQWLEALQQTVRFFRLSNQTGPYRETSALLSGPTRAKALAWKDLLGHLRQGISEHDTIFFAPDIPKRKQTTVERLYGLRPSERVALVYDETLFGSAKHGLAITTMRFCLHDVDHVPFSVEFENLCHEDIVETNTDLCVRGIAQSWTWLCKKELAETLHGLVDLAASSG
jgi:hypothetical protein